MRVLLVEDEASLRMTLAANLELEGVEVVEAETGEHALELVRDQAFDIVLSDVRMPGMGGVAMYQRMKSERPDLPVILMTAFALEGQIREALRNGVYTVLSKPFDIGHAVKTLTRASHRPVIVVVDAADAPRTVAALSAAGLRARAEVEPEAVLAAIRDGTVDVCIADLAGSGAQALVERIVAIDPHVSIIALAATSDPVAMSRVATAVHAFLRKPVAIHDLVEVVAKARRMALVG